jgi:hypothetical protein
LFNVARTTFGEFLRQPTPFTKLSTPLCSRYHQVALLLVLPVECSKWRNTSVRRNKARKAIILCCGKNRCLDFVSKKRNFSQGTTSNGTIKNRISSTPATQKAATSTSFAAISESTTFELTAAALVPAIVTTAG